MKKIHLLFYRAPSLVLKQRIEAEGRPKRKLTCRPSYRLLPQTLDLLNKAQTT